MAKRPTIRDLAEASGVSAATVDRVLNGRTSVRTATALRVLDTARRIGFHATPLLQQRIGGEKPALVAGLILPGTEREFYAHFQAEAEKAARAFPRSQIKLIVDFLPSITPVEIVAKMEAMAARTQAIGLVSIDHPRITEEVERLRENGIPVFALLSDFAQGAREAYIGTNNLKVGRTAASMLARGIPKQSESAEVALFVGGHRWHGHELRETGFRVWFRQNRPEISILSTLVNLDTAELTYEATLSLISRHPRLAAIYCAGGGREGVINAVRDEGHIGRIDVVANEFTEVTKRAMTDGAVSLVINTPARAIMHAFYDMALDAVTGEPGHSPGQVFLQTDLILPESF